MAGLLAARVLSDSFARVTVLERDHLSSDFSPRKGIPQGNHSHALLARGFTVMEHLFPNLGNDFLKQGAIPTDPIRDGFLHQYGVYKLRFSSGLNGYLATRPLIEEILRRRMAALPNVTLRPGSGVSELMYDPTRECVTGVRLNKNEETITADLVVDASGRGSKSPHWLKALGYDIPEESTVKVDLGYASRLYRRVPGDFLGCITVEKPPHGTRGAVLVAQENDLWMLTLFGYAGDHPPTDEQGFNEFIRSLPIPIIAEVIQKTQPCTEISVYKIPSSLRRHYERLRRFPMGYLVLGDALCSFNPVYGQGMSVSAAEMEALQMALHESPTLEKLAKRFYKRVTPLVDVPWSLAAGGDLAYAHVEGQRGPIVRLLNAYVVQVHFAAAVDQAVARAFFRVANLVESPMALFKPDIIWRVLRAPKPKPTTTMQPRVLADRHPL